MSVKLSLHTIIIVLISGLNKDTAQNYTNEPEAGIAIRECGIPRKDIFVTTKWSGLNGLDIATSFQNSLKNVGILVLLLLSVTTLASQHFLISSAWNISIYTLSTELSYVMIYRSVGRRWRK